MLVIAMHCDIVEDDLENANYNGSIASELIFVSLRLIITLKSIMPS